MKRLSEATAIHEKTPGLSLGFSHNHQLSELILTKYISFES